MTIDWSQPVFRRVGGSPIWHREWCISDSEKETQDGFWLFWKSKKFSLMNKGYRIFKDRSKRWFFSQSVKDKSEFDKDSMGKPVKEKPFVSKLKPYKLKDTSGLREWQIPSAERIISSLEAYNGALDGSDTGVGKTYSAIAVARDLGYNIGVICPKSIIDPWKKVISNHFKMKKQILFVMNYESVKTGKFKHIASWVKNRQTHREKFVWNVPSKNTLLIFDESHKCKSRDSQNMEMLIAAKKQGYKILCMSATSAINPLEMKALGLAINLYTGAYWKWANQHGVAKGRFGPVFNESKDILIKLNRDIFEERGIRLRRDTIKNFPECLIESEAYSIDEQSREEMNRIYKEMEAEIKVLERKSGMSNKDKKLHAMTLQLRMRQKFELLKIPLFLEHIEEAIEDGFSVAVFLNFTDTIDALAERLGTKCIVDGRNKKTEREDNIEAFQRGKSRIILLNIQAGGCGVSIHNVHGNYPRLALISPNPSAVLMRQSLGRVWRDSSKTKSIQKIIFVSGTAEETVCENVKNKLKNLDLLNDGELALSKTTEF